jgi:hypothetical protein
MPRFRIDEDLPHLLASLLLEKGHESQHIRDLALRGSPDSRIYEAAQQRQATLVTGIQISAICSGFLWAPILASSSFSFRR